MEKHTPKLFVVTGPSGVGKGTIIREFLKSNENVKYSISSTTRAPRPGEVNGREYFFISTEEFEEFIMEDDFLEWAKYNNNYYGTSRIAVAKMMEKGYDVLLEIEVQGALQIIEKVPDCISIFILPPSLEELERRLRGRHTEDEGAIQKRLEIARNELSAVSEYKYCVVNKDISEAVSSLNEIYQKEKEC